MDMAPPPPQEIVCDRSEESLRTVQLEERQVLLALLKDAGIPPEQLPELRIRASKMGNLSRVYLLESPAGTSFLKLSDKQGARGGFFIKFLNRGTWKEQEAGKIRRRQVRHLVSSANRKAGRQLAPEPLCFKEGVFEYRVPERIGCIPVFSDSVGCIMTRWAEVKGTHVEMLEANGKRHDPTSYSPETVRKLVHHLWTFQKMAGSALENKDVELLIHEQRHPQGWQAISTSLLATFGLTQDHLEALKDEELCSPDVIEALRSKAALKAEEITRALLEVATRLGVPEETTLEELSKRFLLQYPLESTRELNLSITSHVEGLPLQETVFYADREQRWPQEVLWLGRRLSQLIVANELVSDILHDKARSTLRLLRGLARLEARYERVRHLPHGIVHQDGHPVNFLTDHDELSLLDLDNISWDVAFSDLSNVYVYKVVRGFVNGKLSKLQTIQLLDAILIPDWVEEHIEEILDSNIASFWNHSRDLADCYELDPIHVNELNVAVTLESFLTELAKREQYDQVYRGELIPLLHEFRKGSFY